MARDRDTHQCSGRWDLGGIAGVRLDRVAAVEGALHGPRAAAVLTGLGELEERVGHVVGRDRRRWVARRVEGEGVDVERDAAHRPVRVVEAGLGEVVEPADEIHRVGSGEPQLGRRPRERLVRRRQRSFAALAVAGHRPDRDVAHRDVAPRQLDQVVAPARAADQLREVADRRPRVVGQRPQLGQERPQLLGHRLGLVDERGQIVQGRP